jgi:hypothetical protein
VSEQVEQRRTDGHRGQAEESQTRTRRRRFGRGQRSVVVVAARARQWHLVVRRVLDVLKRLRVDGLDEAGLLLVLRALDPIGSLARRGHLARWLLVELAGPLTLTARASIKNVVVRARRIRL